MEDNDQILKKEYEISFLVRNEGDIQEVLSLLKQHEAEVFLENPIKKIALAYKIKNETNACFGCVHFRVDPKNTPSIDRDLKTKSSILRFIIITPPFIKDKSFSVSASSKPRNRSPISKKQADISRPAPPLSNEALEKKIEEILQ